MKKWDELRDFVIQQLESSEAGENHEYEKAARVVLEKMDGLDEKYQKQ